MTYTTQPASWTVTQAVAIAYTAFAERFGADLLHGAFAALTTQPEATMTQQRALGAELDSYISHAMTGGSAWMDTARADPKQASLLLHLGVRWWLARDAMLHLPTGTLVPCQYAEGLTDHVSLQLLGQMLHRGGSPDTAHSSSGKARQTLV